MLVSAVSADYSKVIQTLLGTEIDKKDTVFKNSSAENADVRMCQLYKDICEWKLFCHKQILAGKLDITA